MSSNLLMNINDLGAVAVNSRVQSIWSSSMVPFYKIFQGNPKENLCLHIFSWILMTWVLWLWVLEFKVFDLRLCFHFIKYSKANPGKIRVLISSYLIMVVWYYVHPTGGDILFLLFSGIRRPDACIQILSYWIQLYSNFDSLIDKKKY